MSFFLTKDIDKFKYLAVLLFYESGRKKCWRLHYSHDMFASEKYFENFAQIYKSWG